MSPETYAVLYRFRYLFGSLLVIACLPLLSISISFIASGQAQATSPDAAQPAQSYNDPNLVADGFAAASNSVSQTATSVATAIQNANKSAETAAVSAAKAVGTDAYSGTAWAAHGIGKSAGFMADIPLYAWHRVSSLTHIGSLINPAETDKTPVPTIDPGIAAEIANSKPILSTGLVGQADARPQWPIQGVITEEFGVPHMPYQPLHTGIDISDGAPAGITPIRPFKPGRVIAVVQSDSGFGNHVIVDHGGGLLSLYGHMYATAVKVGQLVDESTVLGLEGSTGVSTGVHVHFEIDLNGVPVNPHTYVAGQP